MLAVTLEEPNFRDPASGARVADRDEPQVPDGWTTVTLKTASLNHHDVWNLRGVGVDKSWLPVIMGSDGAGVDADGNDVIVYPLLASAAAGGGDETLDPRRRMISDGIDGTFAERIAVPRENLVAKPEALSWEAAASLPTAWLTAYRVLFTRGALRPGQTVLVQGAGGGLSTAVVALGKAAGLRVWVTSRDAAKGERAVSELGADGWFESGARLPERVDAVVDSVGKATWSHSLKSLRPGGTLLSVGATTGADPDPDLSRVFLNQITVAGCAMGTREELRRLVAFCVTAGIAPTVDTVLPLAEATDGIARMAGGELFGKVVFRCDGA